MKDIEYHPIHTSEQELLREHGQRILELLENTDVSVGEGRTARVHHGVTSSEVCYKMILDVDGTYYNKGLFYTNVEGEAEFLESLRGLDTEVRVPKAYGTIAVYDPQRLDVLVMERLNAVSIKDILEGKEPLPSGANIPDFFVKLSQFVKAMHERGIYHRDLHEGNIMIDVDTGAPYVIDFGSSKKLYFGDENPYVEVDQLRGEKMYYTDDLEWVKRVQRSLETHLQLTKEQK